MQVVQDLESYFVSLLGPLNRLSFCDTSLLRVGQVTFSGRYLSDAALNSFRCINCESSSRTTFRPAASRQNTKNRSRARLAASKIRNPVGRAGHFRNPAAPCVPLCPSAVESYALRFTTFRSQLSPTGAHGDRFRGPAAGSRMLCLRIPGWRRSTSPGRTLPDYPARRGRSRWPCRSTGS